MQGGEAVIFTARDVAEFLRTDLRTIEEELATGRLAGFKVAGEWRILQASILDFLGAAMKAEQEEAFRHTLADSRTWARELRRDPALCASIEEQGFPPDTMGAFLKMRLRAWLTKRNPTIRRWLSKKENTWTRDASPNDTDSRQTIRRSRFTRTRRMTFVDSSWTSPIAAI